MTTKICKKCHGRFNDDSRRQARVMCSKCFDQYVVFIDEQKRRVKQHVTAYGTSWFYRRLPAIDDEEEWRPTPSLWQIMLS